MLTEEDRVPGFSGSGTTLRQARNPSCDLRGLHNQLILICLNDTGTVCMYNMMYAMSYIQRWFHCRDFDTAAPQLPPSSRADKRSSLLIFLRQAFRNGSVSRCPKLEIHIPAARPSREQSSPIVQPSSAGESSISCSAVFMFAR